MEDLKSKLQDVVRKADNYNEDLKEDLSKI